MSVQSIISNLQRVERQIYAGIRDGLVAEGEEIMSRSNKEFAPEDSGDLIDSSQVVLVEDGTLEGLSVVLSYGDEKTSQYVIATHETPSGSDPPTWQGKEVKFTKGGPKYLERPLFEAENGMAGRIAKSIKIG